MRKSRVDGFTLVELLVSLGVLALLLLVTANVINQVQKTWTSAAARVSQFREARVAFEALTRNLRQSTLNAHIDYDFNYLSENGRGLGDAPEEYLRKSDLHFVVGRASSLVSGASATSTPGHAVFFQAPLGVVHDPAYAGLDNLLCGRGYFVQYASDAAFRPPFVTKDRFRFRLMEFSPPAEKNRVYDVVPAGTPTAQRQPYLRGWYQDAGDAMDDGEDEENRSLTRPVADNIILLVLSPRLEPGSGSNPTEVAPGYSYDSADPSNYVDPRTRPQGTLHLLPPQIRIAMVAIDEKTAEQLQVEDRLSDLGNIVSQGFTNASRMDEDLAQVSEELIKEKINFKVFTATVGLPGSKWSN